MLGGMIGPSVEEAAVTQQEKSLSNPFSFMALISMAPRPQASDTAVPDLSLIHISTAHHPGPWDRKKHGGQQQPENPMVPQRGDEGHKPITQRGVQLLQ